MKNDTGHYLYNLSAFYSKKQNRNKDIKDRKKNPQKTVNREAYRQIYRNT